jgi:hypothetical protein
MSMKERVDNPIGPLLLDHLHEKMEKLYTYLVNESNSEVWLQRRSHVLLANTFLVDPT